MYELYRYNLYYMYMYELAAALLIIGAATPRVVSQIVSSHKYKFEHNINSLTSISMNTMQYRLSPSYKYKYEPNTISFFSLPQVKVRIQCNINCLLFIRLPPQSKGTNTTRFRLSH